MPSCRGFRFSALRPVFWWHGYAERLPSRARSTGIRLNQETLLRVVSAKAKQLGTGSGICLPIMTACGQARHISCAILIHRPILAAGRRVPRTGGMIFAAGERDAVDAMAKRDPFNVNGIADYVISEVNITSTADGLEKLKG